MKTFTRKELKIILENHRLWLNGSGGYRAYLNCANLKASDLNGANLRHVDLYSSDLSYANLAGANLIGTRFSDANLTGSDLRGSDLRGANLSNTNLTLSNGIIWAQIGPIGNNGRTLTAAYIENEIVFYAGCFKGSPKEFEETIVAGGWYWLESDYDSLAKGCRKAAKYCVKSIEQQLEGVK